MNVTNDGCKDRQHYKEHCLQMVSTEPKVYAEVSARQRIAENNRVITDFQPDGLPEKILQPDNLNNAYKKVKSNKGAGGADGMSVDELLPFLRDRHDIPGTVCVGRRWTGIWERKQRILLKR